MCVVGEFGDGVSVIWLDDVVCEGDEEQVADCQHSGWGEHNCVPEENIAIRCTCKRLLLYISYNIFIKLRYLSGISSRVEDHSHIARVFLLKCTPIKHSRH